MFGGRNMDRLFEVLNKWGADGFLEVLGIQSADWLLRVFDE